MTRQVDDTLRPYVSAIYEQATGWRIDDRERSVLLEGSLAEGFGNMASDLDFLVVLPGNADPPLMPTLKFCGGRRVEVRQRSAGQLRAQFQAIARDRRSGFGPKFEDMLDRCQRFLCGLVLSDPDDIIQTINASIDTDRFAGIVSAYSAMQARRSLHLASAAILLDDGNSVREWAQNSLHYSAKAWLATKGETYVSRKWLHPQIDRVGAADVGLRFTRLATLVAGGPIADAVTGIYEFGRELGTLKALDTDPNRVHLRRVRHTTTWEIGGRLHIIHRGKRVYALNSAAAEIWRSLRFNRPLLMSLRDMGTSHGSIAPRFLHFLWRQGLIRLAWQGGENLANRLGCGGEACLEQPMVTLRGGPADDTSREAEARYLAINARDFASAGMSLVWSNVMIENAFEDIEGALKADQLAVVNWTFGRVIKEVALALLSAQGAVPLPPREEAVTHVIRSNGPFGEVREIIDRLVNSGQAESIAEARRTFDLVKRLVDSARHAMGFEDFPKSFEASANWYATTDIGYDWVRMGAYLQSDFPIEEARDLLSRHGDQPDERDFYELPDSSCVSAS